MTFIMELNTSKMLFGPLDFHSGPNNGLNQHFWSKMADQVSMIWIKNDVDSIN